MPPTKRGIVFYLLLTADVQPRRKRGADGTSEPLGRNAEEFLT